MERERRVRPFRVGISVGMLAALVYWILRSRSAPEVADWAPAPQPAPQPEPAPVSAPPAQKAAAPAAKKAAAPKKKLEPWVTPDDEGTCPTSHPVKAKAASKIFHVPGQLAYHRTIADRCYADPAAAEADGYRPAKR